jgi:glucose-6-phosphate isomerase
MNLKFLANVDPIDFEKALDGLDIEETLFVVVSKTFTTAETMLNARSARAFIQDHFKNEEAVGAHMCAVSTNLEATSKFGIDSKNVFGFWDWVGGRFSVSSAVGLLPLSLYYGWDVVSAFLAGMHQVDQVV